MPMAIGADGDAVEDRVALVVGAVCMLLAATESLYGTAWYAMVIANDLSLGHAMKVNVMLSVFAKIVTVAQIGAVSSKMLVGRRHLIKLTNDLNAIESILFGTRSFSWEILVTSGVMCVTTLATFFAYMKHYEVDQNDVWRTVADTCLTIIKFVNCCVISAINLQFWGFCQVNYHTQLEINN
jgi:hypothetical protein